jgi:hypothetical protein
MMASSKRKKSHWLPSPAHFPIFSPSRVLVFFIQLSVVTSSLYEWWALWVGWHTRGRWRGIQQYTGGIKHWALSSPTSVGRLSVVSVCIMTFADGVLTKSTLKMEGHHVLAVPSFVYLVYSSAVLHTPRPFLQPETWRHGVISWCKEYEFTLRDVTKDTSTYENNNSRQDRNHVLVCSFACKMSE